MELAHGIPAYFPLAKANGKAIPDVARGEVDGKAAQCINKVLKKNVSKMVLLTSHFY